MSSHANAASSQADGVSSHANAASSQADGASSQADGASSQADGASSQADGASSQADGVSSHANAASSQADGASSQADGASSQADGASPQADGASSQANGVSSRQRRIISADGASSQADGASPQADAASSQADGASSQADGASSQANGASALLKVSHTWRAGLMALWNSGITWTSGALWGPAAPPSGPTPANTKPKRNTMPRDKFYPALLAEQPEWHNNLAAKFPLYGPALGFTPAQINNAVADNLYLAYALGDWITRVREFGPAATAALKDLRTGTGNDPFTFTAFTPPTLPTLPAGVTDVLPGALDRTFGLVQGIKGAPGYNEGMGLDMGIVGSEITPPPPGDVPPPQLTAVLLPGDDNQYVRLKFIKRGHEYVVIESRRAGGAWEQLVQSNKSPYIDERALLVPGQAEVREYRARFWDDGKPSSDWCGVLIVTVGP
ncbi:MAG: hypothetical protein HS117_10425 [Verrucomicrobiaceae bacterium]|nr:hypothetical protein [Verrucomicrobiaceae bacterium]